MSMSEEEKHQIDELVTQWLAVDIDEESRLEIENLQKWGDYRVLSSKMSPRIAFGTAGLRSSMEPGFAHMNDVTILQASQGLVKYILQDKNGKKTGASPSIVIGYDHRHHSQRFAEITASVAVASGLTVYYLGSVDNLSEESMKSFANTGKSESDSAQDFNSSAQNGETQKNSKIDRSYVHTPMVPFGIDHYGASAGVMVTASHNPARDNGYKVYYGNGCQIIPPHDSGIAKSIDENLRPWLAKNVWDIRGNFAAAGRKGKLIPVKNELTSAYIAAVMTKLVKSPKVSFDFVYTPMHGVGGEIFGQICDRMSVKYAIVPEQAHPDPEFPTVRFPNPEEAGALDLAIAQAKKAGYKLVVANDPDADRFSVAVETKERAWRQLTGNEIGVLFAAYVLEELTRPEDMSNTYLLNSTVSSQLLRSMAEKLGCHFQDTLTGFKWIGNKAIDLKKRGFNVPFGYEEAIGYMLPLVNDKDGISASVMWMQLYEKWFSTGDSDPLDKLEAIYARFGWFKECNGYYKLDDLQKTAKIFKDTIRASYDAATEHPSEIGDFAVIEWRDLTVGYDSAATDHKPLLPTDPSSQMITAILQLKENGASASDKVRFTCRGSGTEPKLKVYIEGMSRDSEAKAVHLARKCWDTLRDEWFRPQENGLVEVV
ncbi:hypothetical protein OY671_006773 [Metschnikowia pulcherrima]|nr:hypothetical protein OY671_006773 [Metschnikowia pulcherrima]